MVRGIDSFREWFSGYESNYVVIGGTACDLLMGSPKHSQSQGIAGQAP